MPGLVEVGEGVFSEPERTKLGGGTTPGMSTDGSSLGWCFKCQAGEIGLLVTTSEQKL